MKITAMFVMRIAAHKENQIAAAEAAGNLENFN